MRVLILAPNGEVVERRIYEDDWYATGGGRPHWAHQQAREESAVGELREWLWLCNPPSGRYTISVSEANGNGAGQLWASVQVVHRRCVPSR